MMMDPHTGKTKGLVTEDNRVLGGVHRQYCLWASNVPYMVCVQCSVTSDGQDHNHVVVNHESCMTS